MQAGGCIGQFYDSFQNLNFERTRRFGQSDYDPVYLKEILEELKNPQLAARTIHIAGTVAKGSTAHFLSRMITASGRSCGLYTSPHLEELTERISIDAQEITPREFCSHWEILSETYRRYLDLPQNENALLTKGRLSFFDAMTAIAFLHFQKRGVDYAVIETGLGGRRDSTNNLLPEFCVITPIDLDHQEILGDTIEKIAAEKAGIIRAGVGVYSYPQSLEAERVIRERATELGSPVTFFKAPPGAVDPNREICRMIYEHHFQNKAPEISTQIKGRFEKMSSEPEVYFDLAHNERAMRYLSEKIAKGGLFSGKTLRFYFNCLQDRHPVELLRSFFDQWNKISQKVFKENKIPVPKVELYYLNVRQEEQLHRFHLTEEVSVHFGENYISILKVLDSEEDFREVLHDQPDVTAHLVFGSSRLYSFVKSVVS